MHLGQILNAAVGPMVMAGPSLMSKVWFPQNQRTFATATAYCGGGIGSALGFLIPSLILDCDKDGDQGVYKECIEDNFPILMAFCVAMSTLSLLASLIYLPAKPKLPPTHTIENAKA